LHFYEPEKNSQLKRGETIPRSISQHLRIAPTKRSEHLIFNFYDFRFFNSSENGSAMTLGNSRLLAAIIAVPYILACETIFLRKWRYFVRLKNQVVGVFILHEKPDSLYISSLAVAPEYRKHGVAKYILDISARIANKHGKRWLQLSVLKKNTPARQLYAKSGFAEKKERRWSLVLQKDLRQRENARPEQALVRASLKHFRH
jgi:ribosomal protein S18 acetylase RimI-like enzyme